MLRVTRLTDYATVVLTVLAAEPDRVLSAVELAERAGLEAPTVSKVLKPLAQAGLLEAFRGAHGGYRLSRPAPQISLIEIVRAIIEFIGFIKCTAFLGILEISDLLLQRINLVQDGLVAGLGFY